MQTLSASHHLLVSSHKPNKTLIKSPKLQNLNCNKLHLLWRLQSLSIIRPFAGNFVVRSFSSDEFPVDETFLENFAPREQESEEVARKRNWIERDWAPWEEILTPEADFARKSLNEGEEVPLQSPESIEAFKMLSPNYRKKKMEESGLSEDEYLAKQFEIKGEILEPLQTTWDGPLVLRMLPPRDWPPRDWKVDEKELAFIRQAHKLQSVRVDLDDVESARRETDDMCLERYQVFLKQYKEWVAENKDRLEDESYKDSVVIELLKKADFLQSYKLFKVAAKTLQLLQ